MKNIRPIIISFFVWLLAVLPSSNVLFFHGLPLDPWPAFGIICFLATIWVCRKMISRAGNRLIIILFAGLLVVQIAAWLILPYGWSVCLRRELLKNTLNTACETSAQFPRGQKSFLTNTVDFSGKKFPLYFMNDTKLNFYHGDNYDRDMLPYSFSAEAFLKRQGRELIVTTNIPKVFVKFNGTEQILVPDQILKLSLADADVNSVAINYTTGRRNSDALLVETVAQPFYRTVFGSIPAAGVVNFIRIIEGFILSLLCGVTLVLLGRYLISLPQQVREQYLYVGAFSVALLATGFFHEAVMALALSAIVIACSILPVRSWKTSWAVPIVLLLLVAGLFVALRTPPGMLKILDGGGDELSYESFARTVMTGQDWQTRLAAGTEKVFYFQPLYRYVLAYIHRWFGDGMWTIYTFQTWIFLVVTVLAGRLIRYVGGVAGVALYVIVLVYVLVRENYSFVKLVTTSNFQEALGISLLLLAVIVTLWFWLLRVRNISAHLLLGLVWGMAIMIRTDFIPALLAVIIYVLAVLWRGGKNRQTRIAVAGLLIGLIIFPGFVLFRNAVIAHQVAIMPISGWSNFTDPALLAAVPWVNAENFGARTILLDLPTSFISRPHVLIGILWANIQSGMVGYDPIRVIGWVAVLFLGLLGLLYGERRSRVALLILLSALVLPIIFQGFFDHTNVLPAFAFASYILAPLLSLAFGFTVRTYYPLLKRYIKIFQ